MKRFARLFTEVDRTTRTGEKTAALRRYFEQAPDADAAWALAVLTGKRMIRAVNTTRLREWAAQASGLPRWLVDESYDAVGDLSETLALLVPDLLGVGRSSDEPLHEVIENRILPLPAMDEAQQRDAILDVWRSFDPEQRFLFHKLISGAFRFGAAKKLVIRALAEAAGVEPAVMEHRVMGFTKPTAENYRRLWRGDEGADDPGRPYPFFLATPMTPGSFPGSSLGTPPENSLADLGDPGEWQAEWKWDGIRAQVIHRHGRVMVWTRGEEVVTDAFPEVREIAEDLPQGVVLDGELLAWEAGAPLPFAALQRRLNRKRVEPMLFTDVPIVFMAYDVLEHMGVDQRDRPLSHRMKLLDEIAADVPAGALRRSPVLRFERWGQLVEHHREARERGVEGVMVKRLASPYRAGRVRGDWWKWKVDPFSVDCVMIYAQRGHGRRATLFSDYTFAVWDTHKTPPELVPVAKAYSGLTDEELDEVDRWIKRHTRRKNGPMSVVEPELVFELAFEGIRASDRHRSGVALRFPRIARWRHDLRPGDADTLGVLRELLDRETGPAEKAIGREM